jgi:uroporphyrinogen decarboxylase-like protein
MNSRQRLQFVLNGDIPDRVPISTYELAGYNSHAFENHDPSYARLMQVIREQTDCVCMWEPRSNAKFLESSCPVELDTETQREADATIRKKTVQTPHGELTRITKENDHIHTVWEVEHWCKSIAEVDQALSLPYEPLDYDVSDFARIKDEVSDQGILMASVADPLWLAAGLMEFGAYTVWALTETDHFANVVAEMHRRNMTNLKRMLEVNVVDLYRICGSEYATPPYLPPEFFRRFVVPYVAEMVELFHNRGAKVRLHCHGRIREVLDMIRQTGADALDPCEAPPDGDITLSEVKEQVGDCMCLFGNIQLKLLEYGDIPQVNQVVKECMAAAKEKGRFVIMPTAAPINSPLAKKTEENYIRFMEAAIEYGKYD